MVDTPSVSVQVRVPRGQQRAGRTQRELSIRFRVQARVESDSESCSANARGEVRSFLTNHRCEAVYRSLYVVSDGGVGAVVAVAVAWIDMVDQGDATELKALVDRAGTGNVDSLTPPRETRVVDLDEPAFGSRQRGRTVVTVEVEPTVRGVPRAALERVAERAADGAASSSR